MIWTLAIFFVRPWFDRRLESVRTRFLELSKNHGHLYCVKRMPYAMAHGCLTAKSTISR